MDCGSVLHRVLGQDVENDEIRENRFTPRDKFVAFMFAFLSVFMYAFGVFYTTLGSKNLDANVANSVRQPVGAFLLMMILLIQPFQSKGNSDGLSLKTQFQMLGKLPLLDKFKIILAGLLGTYVSAVFLVLSTQELGAGKTAVLTATGPLFALPLAIFWLKEKAGILTIIGTSLSLIGLWFSIT